MILMLVNAQENNIVFAYNHPRDLAPRYPAHSQCSVHIPEGPCPDKRNTEHRLDAQEILQQHSLKHSTPFTHLG